MTNLLSNTNGNVLPKNYLHVDYQAIRLDWTRWHAGATFGLAGGFLVGFSGVFLMFTAYFSGSSGESQTATWLIIGAVPLVWFGAHALDKIDEQDKAQRLENCKKFGYSEQQCRRDANIDAQK